MNDVKQELADYEELKCRTTELMDKFSELMNRDIDSKSVSKQDIIDIIVHALGDENE